MTGIFDGEKVDRDRRSSLALSQTPVPVIVDEDMNSDCDDVMGLAVQHALMSIGKIRIIAMGTPVSTAGAAEAMHAVNWFYGRPSIPIGINSGSTITGNVTGMAANIVSRCFDRFIGGAMAFDEAVDVYRRALATQADGSVVMVFGGQLLNLLDLWNSAADSVSPLTGAALIKAKVKEIVIVGGEYPGPGHEYNFYTDTTGAAVVNSLVGSAVTGVQITFVGFETGELLKTGQTVRNHSPLSPVRVACDTVLPAVASNYVTGRQAWGSIAAVVHLYSTEFGFSFVTGTNAVDGSGNNTWTNGAGPHRYTVMPTAGANRDDLGDFFRTLESYGSDFNGSGAAVVDEEPGHTYFYRGGAIKGIIGVNQTANDIALNSPQDATVIRAFAPSTPLYLTGPDANPKLGVSSGNRACATPFIDFTNTPGGTVYGIVGNNSGLVIGGGATDFAIRYQGSNCLLANSAGTAVAGFSTTFNLYAIPQYFCAAGFGGAVQALIGTENGGGLITGAATGTLCLRGQDKDIWFCVSSSGNPSHKFTANGIGLGASGPTWTNGTGSPEGVVTAPVGSLYSRTDGGAGTTLYVKQSGTGNTGWAAK